MFNLVRNEMSKIVKKKTFIFYIAILVIYIISSTFGIKALNGLITDESNVDNIISLYENEVKIYDYNNPNQRDVYVSSYTSLQQMYLVKEVGYGTWRETYLEDNYSDKISEYALALVENRVDDANKLKSELDQIVNELKNNDYGYIISKDLDKYNKIINSLKVIQSTDDVALMDSSVVGLYIDSDGIMYTKDEVDELKENVEKLTYKKECVTDPDSEEGVNALSYIDIYFSTRDELKDIDYSKLTKTSDKKEYISDKQTIEKYKYIIDHKLFKNNEASATVTDAMDGPSVLLLIGFILVAGPIIAEEFNKGTIKQLLLRPYTRNKILTSKILTVLLCSLLFIGIYFVTYTVTAGAVYGFDKFGISVYYDFANSKIITYNFLTESLIELLAYLPCYLIFIALTFALSIISKNTGLTNLFTIGGYLSGTIINELTYESTYKLLKFFPSYNWDVSSLLFGNISNIKGLTIGFSLIYDAILIVVLVVISFVVFKKTDIKNQ